jgi:hypothetical protein
VLFASQEKFVLKTLLVLFIPRFVKVVHIELPYKRTEIVVFEILRQYILSECVRVLDNKSIALLVPKHSIRVSCILNRLVRFSLLTLTIS